MPCGWNHSLPWQKGTDLQQDMFVAMKLGSSKYCTTCIEFSDECHFNAASTRPLTFMQNYLPSLFHGCT